MNDTTTTKIMLDHEWYLLVLGLRKHTIDVCVWTPLQRMGQDFKTQKIAQLRLYYLLYLRFLHFF